MNYVAPDRGLQSFTCPNCGVLAQQFPFAESPQFSSGSGYHPDKAIATAVCQSCDRFSLWVRKLMVFPPRGTAPQPNPDLPDSVRRTYEEAAAIAARSPRGAAALLRLAIQLLCKELGEPGKDINKDIGSLVKKGLPVQVQQSLDVVRVVGNNAVHPGQIDTDDPGVASSLFELTNVIAEYMVSLPNKVGSLYESLPPGARDAIDRRDGNESSPGNESRADTDS